MSHNLAVDVRFAAALTAKQRCRNDDYVIKAFGLRLFNQSLVYEMGSAFLPLICHPLVIFPIIPASAVTLTIIPLLGNDLTDETLLIFLLRGSCIHCAYTCSSQGAPYASLVSYAIKKASS